MNVVIFGAGGRMGNELVKLAKASRSFKLVAAIDSHGNGTHRRIQSIRPPEKGVVIDFSSPSGLREALAWSIQNKWAFVSGTTGITKKEENLLKGASKTIPVLWASNMSLGIAVLGRLINELTCLEHDFDFQIEEFHHKYKKDAPSGTAVTLQKRLQKSVSKKLPPVVSIRGGGIFGVHTVWAMSEEEVLRLEHQALNRAVFAKGAFIAARFLSKKKKGLYGFDEVLG